MNTKTIVAVLLITLGVVVLAYSGITFKTPGKPVEFLGIHIETTHSHFIPPVAGALALVGGIVLLLVNPKRVD
jgi:nitrate reductase gamma subunit